MSKISVSKIPLPSPKSGQSPQSQGPGGLAYEIQILQSIRRIIRAVDLHSRKLSSQYKVTAPQLVCLLFIRRHPGCTLSTVSKGIHLSSSTVVGILDRLELKGWTQRVRDTKDRRIVRIKLTAKGKGLLQKAPSPLQDKLLDTLNELPELEQATIALSLEKLTTIMEAEDLDASPILETGSVKSPPLGELPTHIIPIGQQDTSSLPPLNLPQGEDYFFEQPKVQDAPLVQQLVRSSPPLDQNSTYLYLILFEHFSKTCVIARSSEYALGFITGYRLPDKPETLFVWQVGVRSDLRGQGLGGKMLLEILRRPENQDITSLETTVNPSNKASRRMFEKFSQEFGAPLLESLLFPHNFFGKTQHEDETLLHIGPLSKIPLSKQNKEHS